MSMSAINSYTRMEFRLLIREPLALFFTLVFPLLLLFIFGSIWGNTPMERYGGFGYITLSLPGFLAMVVATSGILTLSSTVASYRETGFFRLLQTTPITPFAVFCGQFLSLFAATAVAVAALLAAGLLVYDVALPGSLFAFSVVFAANCAALFSFGFLIATLLPTVRTTQTVAMGLFFPMLFLCGAALPAAILPEDVREFARFLPLTQTVNLFYITWFGGQTAAIVENVVLLGWFTLLNVLVASRAFIRAGDAAVARRGLFFAGAGYLTLWVLAVALLGYF